MQFFKNLIKTLMYQIEEDIIIFFESEDTMGG